MPDHMTITVEPAFAKADVFDEIEHGRWRIEQGAAIIWATGPNVLTALDSYPLGCYHMGVNGAIDLPVHLHSRVVLDRMGWQLCDWGRRTLPNLIEIHSNAIAPQFATLQFQAHVDRPHIRARKLPAECTVSGAALALLYWCYKWHGKPKTVYLAGCDMGGGVYFNGYATLTPGRWSQADCFNELIRECKAGGLQVLSLTETLLEVEHA